MKILPILTFSLGALVGCFGGVQKSQGNEIEITNRSSSDLTDASVKFGDHTCRWGVVGRTFSASYLGYPFPITQDVELKWKSGGLQHEEKINLKGIYSSGQSGRLTFVVLDEGVRATFAEKGSR